MKPIIVIYIPLTPGGKRSDFHDRFCMIEQYAERKSKGSHTVICMPSLKRKDVKIEVFDGQNVPDLEIQKLKSDIKQYAKKVGVIDRQKIEEELRKYTNET